MKQDYFYNISINIIPLILIFLITNTQPTEGLSVNNFLDKSKVSGFVFRGRISTTIPHPVDSSVNILRIRVSKFLKGCGDPNINVYISNNDNNIKSLIEKSKKEKNNFRFEILFFACSRDQNGISFDLSKGLDTDSAFVWEFDKFLNFENELKKELGCLGCCESGGECGVSIQDAEQLNLRKKAKDDLNKSDQSKQDIGGLLTGFKLGRNKKGANLFFGK